MQATSVRPIAVSTRISISGFRCSASHKRELRHERLIPHLLFSFPSYPIIGLSAPQSSPPPLPQQKAQRVVGRAEGRTVPPDGRLEERH